MAPHKVKDKARAGMALIPDSVLLPAVGKLRLKGAESQALHVEELTARFGGGPI